jgi:hypothetical protein
MDILANPMDLFAKPMELLIDLMDILIQTATSFLIQVAISF